MSSRRSVAAFAGLVTIGAAAMSARADVGYDAISNITPPGLQQQSSAMWLADDVYLAPGVVRTLTHVDVRTRMGTSAPQADFSGALRLAVFSQQVVFPGGVTPGTLLWQTDVPVSWTRGVTTDIGADIPNLALSSSSFWIGWQFLNAQNTPVNGSAIGLFVLQNTSGPVVGVTTADYANTQTLPTWSVLNSPNTYSFALRVSTLPSPGAALVLIGSAVMFTRRRR